MLAVPPRATINIKRRAVPAVREFPKGCGTKVSLNPNPPPPVELNSKPKEANADPPSEASGSLKVEERRDSIPIDLENLRSENAVKSESLELPKVKTNGHVEEEEEASCSMKCVNGDVREEHCSGTRFLDLKRRKVSAVRDFPAGCGRAGYKVCKKASSEVGHVAYSESKAFDDEKKAVGSGDKADDEVRMNGDHKDEGSVVVESLEKTEDEVRKKDAETSDGEKKKPVEVGVSSGEKLEGGVERNESEIIVKVKEETTIKFPKVKRSGEEKQPLDSAEMVELNAEVNSNGRISEEMKPVVKQEETMVGAGRFSSVEMVETEADKNETKKITKNAQESSSEDRVKSPLKSSSRESILDYHGKNKILIHYSSKKKLEGRDVKQVGKNLQVKESRDVRAPSGIKIADKVGTSSVDKRSIDIREDGKNPKRKLPEEERDESLEAYGDRKIVHALMAAENCPWRKGRKSGGIVSHSIIPKVKANKAKKFLGSNSASVSSRASTYVHEHRVDVEDEEDSPPQDGGNETPFAICKGSRDLCITMTPSVPSGLVSKGSSSDEAASRNMVKRTLRMFQLICRKLVQREEKSKGKLLPGKEANSKDNSKTQRVDLKAASMLKERNQWVNHGEPIIGHVPGVEVGDEFHYRVELSIIGIHRPFQGGIDYTKNNGMVLATSIVASGGYPDDIDSSDVLIYSGSGGNAAGGGDKQAGDQKLERGNLALKNSIDARSPVRVVYGSKEFIKSDSHDARPKLVATFTYDGLYIVEKYWPERGNNGFNVFKFQLRRMPGQPEIALKEVKKTKKSKIREGLCVKDISDGKESIPICAVNTVDSDRPMPFKYITRVMYPSSYVKKPPRGCDCTDGCSDSEKCACAVKNGGEIPFNFNGAIVQAKPLVYECGPSCRCPPSCHNRVSQHGIRLPLEIFKTRKRGWGLRSLFSIPSGTFVCEYVGEMLEEADAEQRINDEYLFDIGHNYDDRNLWEGLPSFIPDLQSDAASETAFENMKDVGYTIDAAEYGNVGRFINHSCSPNLYAQNLLYDNDDKKIPHVMFFAIDNIPPLQELTYHYNYNIDQVRDPAGNIKKKECLCGSSECTGRLY